MARAEWGPSRPVEVRSTYRDGHWATGFEIAEVVRNQQREFLRLRRRSDGALLPALFPIEDVRGAGAP